MFLYMPTKKIKILLNIAKERRKGRKANDYTYMIIDTAGRLHVDEALMEELVK